MNGYPRVREVVRRVDGAVAFGLYALGIQMLSTVTLPIEKAHAHQRQSCVCRGFDMVARQHTEPTRIGVKLGP